MKKLFFTLLITIFAATGFDSVHADTNPERTRATITRTSGELHDRASRESEDSTPEDEEEEDEEGDGVILDVTFNNGGQVEINFEGGGTGGANISITINGQVVSSSGEQQNGGGNTSEDGQDGQDGRDGEDNSSPDEDESEEDNEEDETNDRTNTRPDREFDDSRDAGRTNR